MLEFLAALILAASLAASGDPEVPGDNSDNDPPIIVSGGGGNP